MDLGLTNTFPPEIFQSSQWTKTHVVYTINQKQPNKITFALKYLAQWTNNAQEMPGKPITIIILK